MKDLRLSLSVLEPKMAICQIDTETKIPEWTQNDIFLSITRTCDELSIVCPQHLVPLNVKSEKDWNVIKVEGTLDFSETGILAGLINPLAKEGIGIFAISTYNTDYILVKSENLDKSLEILGNWYEIL
jgi:uncharacterized protein